LPRHAASRLLCLVASAALWACATEPDDTVRDLATLSTLPDQGLEAPDTVRAGVPFTVTGYGAGSGTVACNAPDGTTVTSSDTLVRIVAYMRYPTGQTMCTMDYRTYPFTVQARLTRVGTATVRFIGAVTTYSRTPVPDSLVKRIIVRP
jgi:hypothetical protein